MKTKIILFVSCFALIFSLLSISCFAYVPSVEIGSTYQFDDVVTVSFNDNYLFFDASGQISLLIDDVEFTGFVVEEGAVVISSLNSAYRFVNSRWEYNSPANTGFEYSSAPVFTIVSWDSNIDTYFLNWLGNNVELVSAQRDTYFYSIYSILGDYIFGGVNLLTAEQSLTLTLISTLLSIAVVLLPVLLVIGFLLRAFRL